MLSCGDTEKYIPMICLPWRSAGEVSRHSVRNAKWCKVLNVPGADRQVVLEPGRKVSSEGRNLTHLASFLSEMGRTSNRK